MIVTLTANPSHDRTLTLNAPLERGSVMRVDTPVTEPGGKGINVARVMKLADHDVLAVLPAASGDPMLSGLDARGLRYTAIAITQPIRTNLTIAEPDGTTTKLNEPGPTLQAPEVEALIEAVVEASTHATWVVLSGSLPPGVDADLYAQIADRLSGTACRIAVDTSGAALASAVADDAATLPHVIKPNEEELAELTGADAAELAANPVAAARAANKLLRGNLDTVLLTMGAAGAMAVTTDGIWQATSPPIQARSTVGAGDSSLAGWILARSAAHDIATSLRWAVAWGSAAASLPGSQLPHPGQTDPDAATATPFHFS